MQSVGHQRSWVRYPVWPHTFVSPSADSGGAVVSYWQKYVHEVLVNRLGGLSLPRKSVVRLIDCPDMTLAVYHGRKTTITTSKRPGEWETELVTLGLVEQGKTIAVTEVSTSSQITNSVNILYLSGYKTGIFCLQSDS